jgi:dTDP-4-amino-4,6-dideoxy-D-galactose acyltransferase
LAAHRDDWLSDVLGIPSFSVDGGESEPAPAGFYYAKVDVGDVSSVEKLTGRGFRVVDVNVVLTRDPDRPALEPSLNVVAAEPEHADKVLEIAGNCFRFSRFHLDPRIGVDAANRVKREWARSHVEGRRGVGLLVALLDGEVAGFLAVLDAPPARVIDLIGVAPRAQGQGVGKALVAAFVELHGPGAGELRVGTQIANVPSLRLYAKTGFVATSSAYVLHLHT